MAASGDELMLQHLGVGRREEASPRVWTCTALYCRPGWCHFPSRSSGERVCEVSCICIHSGVIGELEEVGGAIYSGECYGVRQPALGGVVRSFARLLFASTPLEVPALQIVRLSDEN